MLEAVSTTDLVSTISLKRSTQILQLSTRSPADYPIYYSTSDQNVAPPALLAGGLFAYFRIETQLKLADLTSGNPSWVRPVPTHFDEFALAVPVGPLLIIGGVLLALGYVGKRRQKLR